MRWYSPRDWIEEPSPTPEDPGRPTAVESQVPETQGGEAQQLEEGPSATTDAEDSVPEPEPEGNSLQSGGESAKEQNIGDQMLSERNCSPNVEEAGSQVTAESDSKSKMANPGNQSDSLHLDSNQSDEKADIGREKSKFGVEEGGSEGDGGGWGAEWDEEWDLVAGEDGEGVEGVRGEGEGVTEAQAGPQLPKRVS